MTRGRSTRWRPLRYLRRPTIAHPLLALVAAGCASSSKGHEPEHRRERLAVSPPDAGSGGQGGESTDGGMGGSGGLCGGPPPGFSGLVDDFEDGDLTRPPAIGVGQDWFTDSDHTGYLDGPAVLPDPDDANRRILHVAGGNHQTWGAAVLTSFRDGCPVDASGYAGLVVRARVSGTAALDLGTPATVPVEFGGTCTRPGSTEVCFDYHGIAITGFGGLTEYRIPFTYLGQQGWGTPAVFDPSSLFLLQLRFGVNQDYDVAVDEIRFVPTQPCAGASFANGLIDDFEDDDARAFRRPSNGEWHAYLTDPVVQVCEECLEIVPDPEDSGNRVMRIRGGATVGGTPPTLSDCGPFDASEYDGIAFRARTNDSFSVFVCDEVDCFPVSFSGGQGWRALRVPFVSSSVSSSVRGFHFYAGGELQLDDVTFYQGAAAVGAACSRSSDCNGAECVTSAAFGGGAPAGGLCTVGCTSTSDCRGWSPTSVCAASLGGYCLETCTVNATLGPGLDPTKCAGRDDMVCAPTGELFGGSVGGSGGEGGSGASAGKGGLPVGGEAGLGSEAGAPGEPGPGQGPTLCQPRCSRDAQCRNDGHCNPGTGLCQSDPVDGTPTGEHCEPNDPPLSSCAGYCDTRSATCRQVCTLGAEGACADVRERTGLAYECLPLFGYWAPGDSGSCALQCDCSAECPKDTTCIAAPLSTPLDRRGICVVDAGANARLVTCSTGCLNGEVRACRGGADCLGSQRCVTQEGSTERTYGPCLCNDAHEGGAGGEAGHDAGGAGGDRPSEGGAPAGGRLDRSSTPRVLDESCSCSVPGSSGSRAEGYGGIAFLLAGLLGRRRVRRRR